MVLKWNPNVQQKVIAEQLGQTEASISRQIKLMLDQGLLRITISPQNRREHITELTVKGLKFTDEALLILNDYHAPVFAELNERQQQQLLEILGRMHAAACTRDGSSMCQHPLDKTN
jgi:DNA-binding MarR family transcriptional regulator